MSLETMGIRIDYNGGKNQVQRMNGDKLKSLKKALIYSYQSATAILSDGKEFRCLINPEKLTNDYDQKIISIPFKDICLNQSIKGKTTEEEVEIGMQAGDVFTWKENNTDWLVCLQKLEETAYFRASIRRCKYTVEIGDNNYKVYLRGPNNTDEIWKGTRIKYNELNYNALMYITKNEETLDYFKRFAVVKIDGNPWEVQAVDSISTEGIIEIALKETFKNTIEEEIEKERNEEEEPMIPSSIQINGYTIVYPYDELQYNIVGITGGEWSVSDPKKAKIVGLNREDIVNVEIITGRSGNFDLIYIKDNSEITRLQITIESL